MKDTYINEHVVHQIEQAPVVAQPGYDGGALASEDAFAWFSGAEVFNTFEQWLIRKKFTADWRRKVVSKRKRLDDEP